MLVQPGDHTKKKKNAFSSVLPPWIHSRRCLTSIAFWSQIDICCSWKMLPAESFYKVLLFLFFSHYLQIRNWLSVCCPRRPISIHLFVWEILLCTFAQEEIPLLRLSFIGLLAVENVKDFLDDCKFCVLYVQLWVVFGVFQNSTDLFLRAKVPLVFHPHLPSSWCRGPVFLYKEEIRLYLDTLYHHKLFMYGLTLTVPL